MPRPSKRELHGPAEPTAVVKMLNEARSKMGYVPIDAARVEQSLNRHAPRLPPLTTSHSMPALPKSRAEAELEG